MKVPLSSSVCVPCSLSLLLLLPPTGLNSLKVGIPLKFFFILLFEFPSTYPVTPL